MKFDPSHAAIETLNNAGIIKTADANGVVSFFAIDAALPAVRGAIVDILEKRFSESDRPGVEMTHFMGEKSVSIGSEAALALAKAGVELPGYSAGKEQGKFASAVRGG